MGVPPGPPTPLTENHFCIKFANDENDLKFSSKTNLSAHDFYDNKKLWRMNVARSQSLFYFVAG